MVRSTLFPVAAIVRLVPSASRPVPIFWSVRFRFSVNVRFPSSAWVAGFSTTKLGLTAVKSSISDQFVVLDALKFSVEGRLPD
jgi:hypothetical protein